jgi:hypothetical protein
LLQGRTAREHGRWAFVARLQIVFFAFDVSIGTRRGARWWKSPQLSVESSPAQSSQQGWTEEVVVI